MTQPASIFEEIYRDYLKQIGQLDFRILGNKIGVGINGNGIVIPFFGQAYQVSPSQIVDSAGKEPIHSIKVVLCKYLLLYPPAEPKEQEWVSYKDFRGSAPFVDGFQNNTERVIAKNFAGKLEALRKASLQLGGKEPGFDWSYQLIMRFDPLPRIPILLLFNDEDEEFPAQCLLLFERRADQYLDLECLAILAWLLADFLHSALGQERKTVM